MECLTFDTVIIYIQDTHRPIGNYLLASYKMCCQPTKKIPLQSS
jgi:hypothetical protein